MPIRKCSIFKSYLALKKNAVVPVSLPQFISGPLPEATASTKATDCWLHLRLALKKIILFPAVSDKCPWLKMSNVLKYNLLLFFCYIVMLSKYLLNIYAYSHRLRLLSALVGTAYFGVGSNQFIDVCLVSVKNNTLNAQLYLELPFQLLSPCQGSANITEKEAQRISGLWCKEMTRVLKSTYCSFRGPDCSFQQTSGTLGQKDLMCFSALSGHFHSCTCYTQRDTVIYVCIIKMNKNYLK